MTSVWLDQIVILSYYRAPFNRNTLYACGIGIIGIPLLIPNHENIPLSEIHYHHFIVYYNPISFLDWLNTILVFVLYTVHIIFNVGILREQLNDNEDKLKPSSILSYLGNSVKSPILTSYFVLRY